MIRCELTACAVITRSASVKAGKDDTQFVSFGITVPVVGRNGEKKNIEVGVTVDGGKDVAAVYTNGRRVNILGILNIVKRNGKVFFNLRADGGVELTKSTDPDKFEGKMEFKGKIGKKGVDEKKDKKDNVFKSFSAFSSDRDGDKTEFTWVRFLYFNPKEGEDFLQPNAYIQAKGELQLGVFKDEISLDCRLEEVSPWELKKS